MLKSCVFFTNGNIKSSIHFYEHKLSGIYLNRYIDGGISNSIPILNNKMDGFLKLYNKDNLIVYNCRYKLNMKIGVEYIYYIDGINTQNITTYICNKKHGLEYKYYSDSKPYGELKYSNGKLEGLSNYYYKNGTTKHLIQYFDDKIDGINIGFYDNGHIRYSIKYKAGNIEGTCTYFYDTGMIFLKYQYKLDIMDGYQTEYHENGKLKKMFIVRNGLLHGQLKMWNIDGELELKCTYNDNKLVENIYMYSNNVKYILQNKHPFESKFTGNLQILNDNKYTIKIKDNKVENIITGFDTFQDSTYDYYLESTG